jgi:hypothetical protein
MRAELPEAADVPDLPASIRTELYQKLGEDETKIDGDEFIFKFVASCLAGTPVLMG